MAKFSLRTDVQNFDEVRRALNAIRMELATLSVSSPPTPPNDVVWQTYTPVWKEGSGAGVVLGGGGYIRGMYSILGDRCLVYVEVDCGDDGGHIVGITFSNGTDTTAHTMTLPVASEGTTSTVDYIGWGSMEDSSPGGARSTFNPISIAPHNVKGTTTVTLQMTYATATGLFLTNANPFSGTITTTAAAHSVIRWGMLYTVPQA